ncbi:hypothetical protein G4Z16_20165 [Streptomyces bathyalis]|uniref:Uncharacterized protein n=1 Tax=Streptomyces bathyalis TaxID=2710756 RepID=A0A7T1T8G1_9ACTN|nr:hypothetical protein [Streptomyces bathyalis]QPP08326.1 hypothetical protein G4Z16_20165 [Streptomyces bathyalis]
MRKQAHGMHVLVAGVLVAAVPVATWGLMGQDDAQGLPPSQLDHAYEPLAIPAGVQTALGIGALLLAAAALVLLVRAWRRGTFDRRWWQVLGPLMVAGLIVGAGWRVLTAGVVGANIGAGLVVLFGAPVVVALALWAAGRGVWLALHRSDRGPGAGVGAPSGSPS